MKVLEIPKLARGFVQIWRTLTRKLGWHRTFLDRKPVDADGEPLPWYTYPAIDFLRSLDLGDARVFEYGCGFSSLFWAKTARSVVAVENDAQWAAVVQGYGVPNLDVHAVFDKEEYAATPLRVGGEFDLVVIDGRHRRACAATALQVVSENGMIIFDNADWYRETCADIRKAGWFEIDFSGLGPINSFCWTTAVFVRADVRFSHHHLIRPVGGLPHDEAV
jgi:hypothetical protein